MMVTIVPEEIPTTDASTGVPGEGSKICLAKEMQILYKYIFSIQEIAFRKESLTQMVPKFLSSTSAITTANVSTARLSVIQYLAILPQMSQA